MKKRIKQKLDASALTIQKQRLVIARSGAALVLFAAALFMVAIVPSNDDVINAIELTDLNNWCSTDGAFTTIDATGDESSGSCWNNGPNHNVWFSFQATSTFIEAYVRIGGAEGSLRYPYIALWDASLTELACESYYNASGDIGVSYSSLVVGNWYYISVDSHTGASYQGSFSLCVSDVVGYDFYEGAREIINPESWRSADAEFTSLEATPDQTAGSCWGTAGKYNRWFRFQATGDSMEVQVLVGGSEGTMRYPYLAIWDDALTEVACASYTGSTNDITATASNLTIGDWYYISVDNYVTESYRGTFSLQTTDVSINFPVEFLEFQGESNSISVYLSWKTGWELNNDHFSVERSADGQLYESLGIVNGTNTEEVSSYNFLDRNPLSGPAYYRLKQVDFDGTFEYSPRIEILPEKGRISHVSIGPNPFSDRLQVDFRAADAAKVQIQLFSSSGQLIKSEPYQVVMGSNAILFYPSAALNPGMYFIQVLENEEIVSSAKLIKL